MSETLDQIFVLAHDKLVALVAMLGLPWLAVIVSLLLPAALCLMVWPLFFAFLTWLERKVLGRIQNRYGPNRVGPFGLLQPIADGIKMLTKEDIVPRLADHVLHRLAPALIVIPAFSVFALLPFGKNMTPADIDVSLLLFFAVSSVSTLALFIAGWGSRNKYSLLGAMRAVAQMVSYELPVVMAAVPVVMIVGSLRIGAVVAAQGPRVPGEAFGSISHWFIWTPWGLFGFALFFVAGMAELNRSPFDIAEGESEIVAGFHTEYSGFKFALFFLAEYLSAIAFAGLASSLFLGGFEGPAPIPSWLWFFGKMFFLIALMMWARGTLPRLRVDQLMGFSWKFLLPLTLVNIVATALWSVWHEGDVLHRAAGWLGSAALLVAAYFLFAKLNAGPAVKKRVYRYADL